MEQPEVGPALELHLASDDDIDMAQSLHSVEMQYAHPIEWENYLRCFFLVAMVFLVGLLAWQPGLLRLSMLMSLANPSRGESLAWKPEPTPPAPPMEQIRQRPPAEWRLRPGLTARWNGAKSRSTNAPLVGMEIDARNWRRLSANPWRWHDDITSGRNRIVDDSAQPPQKPASSFRAGNIVAWPEVPQTSTTPSLYQATPEAGLPPLLPPLPSQTPGATVTFPTLPVVPVTPTAGLENVSGVSLPPLESSARVPVGTETSALPNPVTTAPIRETQPGSPLPTATVPRHGDEIIDWKNQEIVGPIANAYLTIYPKLKFVGLCVPGQGYIRKYNQIGVPEDLSNPKMAAQDGRTPYGKYYIADRHRDADGPRLYLSWPSPEDAQRIGLDPGKLMEVGNAWRRQALPPQDTVAGGGVGLNGLRNWVEVTEGGFSLELPAMEEIFTALPDKAWVFIQP